MAARTTQPRTLFDKIWDDHVVRMDEHGTALLYIDRQLVHEVTSPQAFEGLRLAGRVPRRPEANLAVPDHNVPTSDRHLGIVDPVSRLQVETLEANCRAFGIDLFDMGDPRQGIVHVIGPEQGFTQPGMTVVCGDSHTSTHGAFGALAFGVGTSEVEHVLATQCLLQRKPKSMLVSVEGELGCGVTAKDIVLAIIGEIGTAGGTGHVIEYAGDAIRALSMEGRMTVCNMSIEAGARAGLIGIDETTVDYVRGRPRAPQGALFEQPRPTGAVSTAIPAPLRPGRARRRRRDRAAGHLGHLAGDGGAGRRRGAGSRRGRRPGQGGQLCATRSRTWGSSRGRPMTGPSARQGLYRFVHQRAHRGPARRRRRAKGRQVADSVKLAMVVPGSGLVKQQAEAEGLDRMFTEAGFEWREPGCSMCLAMNADRLEPGERCASTSNRNFEGRQGQGGRTHLVSPAMAAAAAVTGHFVDVRAM